MVTCSDPNCPSYPKDRGPLMACANCCARVHYDCGVSVNLVIWCEGCQKKKFNDLNPCFICGDNFLDVQHSYMHPDGKNITCKPCFEKLPSVAGDDEDDDDDDVAMEDQKLPAESNKESMVEEVEYSCCSKDGCTVPDEPVQQSEHTQCSCCKKYCHVECFAESEGPNLCLFCAKGKEEDKGEKEEIEISSEGSSEGEDSLAEKEESKPAAEEEEEEEEEFKPAEEEEEEESKPANEEQTKPRSKRKKTLTFTEPAKKKPNTRGSKNR